MGTRRTVAAPGWSGLRSFGGGVRGASRLGLVVFAQRADPDIPEADGITVFVEFDKAARGVGFIVIPEAAVGCAAVEFLAVVDDHSVVNDGDVGFLGELTAFIPEWGLPDDVVGLPFAGRAGGVHERGLLTVDGGGLAVGVGQVVVGVEDLDLVFAVDVDAVIAAPLTFTDHDGGSGKLEVELEIAELVAGADDAGLGRFHVAIHDFPLDIAFGALPFGEIFTVEEHDGIGGRSGELAEGCAWGDDFGQGSVRIMNVPLPIGLHGGIGVALGRLGLSEQWGGGQNQGWEPSGVE